MSHQRKKNFSSGTFPAEYSSEAKERKFESLNFPPKVQTEDQIEIPMGYSSWPKEKPPPMDPSGHIIGKFGH